jgi:HSP20 family protein
MDWPVIDGQQRPDNVERRRGQAAILALKAGRQTEVFGQIGGLDSRHAANSGWYSVCIPSVESLKEDLHMKLISQEFLHNIAPQLDLLNTLGGGVAQPQVRVQKREQGVVIRVSAPSVRPETLHVVLNDNRLDVFAEYRHAADDTLVAPLFVQRFELPEGLDVTRIDAVHADDELRVRIPYQDPNDRQREINIRRR